MDEDEWKKLPTDQKVVHKSWKARAEGYKECIKNFPVLDEKDFNKYLGLVKKFVIDSNELNRVQGLQAAIVFVGTANVAGKCCSEVVSGVMTKCFNSKPKLRELGIELCQLFVEIDKNEATQEELMKGFDNKQPKIIHACLDAITFALRDFGSKVIQVKPLLKQTLKLVDHRDKNVREATKALFVEIFRWIGPAIKAPLQNINPVVLKELEEEWEKVGGGKQTRFMRSQQELKEKMEEKRSQEGEEETDNMDQEEQIDPFDLLEPVEILSQLPKNFFDQIEAKKWQERKEMLEVCSKLTQNPRLSTQGDYTDLVKALKKVVAKDTNVMLVTMAIKCLGSLASGLRKKFHPFALLTLEALFDRFKEKKITVVSALEEASDAVFSTTNVPAISESCIEYLANKNPSIRAQTALFLSRSISKTKGRVFVKPLVKQFTQALLKNVDHSDSLVRESAYKAIGMLKKIAGDAKIQPFLADLDKIKMAKIDESAGKSEVQNQQKSNEKQQDSAQNKTANKPKSSSAKPTGGKEKEKKAVKKKAAAPKSQPSDSAEPPPEAELSDEVAEEQVAAVIGAEVRGQIANSNWKERFAGLQAALQMLKMKENIPVQAFVKVLTAKPGLKDNNFNCLNEKFKTISYLASNGKFSKTSAGLCLTPTVDKIGDMKCGNNAKETLVSISEACGFPWTVEQILDHSMSQKNPKIQSESLVWLTSNLRDFGVAGLNVKAVIQKCKIALAASNPNVRNSSLTLVGVLSIYIGDKLRIFFESEKPALLQQIDQEIGKVKGETPPVPTKGKKKVDNGDKLDDSASSGDEQAPISLDDLITRVDISDKITDSLVAQLSDKDWKLRKQGLEEVAVILSEAKFVAPNLGDLPAALKARLSDSNKILVTTTLNLLIQLSEGLGVHCSKYLGQISSSVISTLADIKPQVRQTALKCMDKWLENTKFQLWLEGDTFSTALSNPKHTFLRVELLNWLANQLTECSKLNSAAKEGLEMCVPHLFHCCEDRSREVRAKAQSCLPGFVKHLGFAKVSKGMAKLPESTKKTIQPLLESARDLVQPEQPKKSPKPNQEPASTKNQAKSDNEKPQSKEKKTKTAKTSSPSAPAAKEEASSLFLNPPNGKEQRRKDEIKLKSIKWVFNTPRDELIQQLQQQLAACIQPNLLTELFHKDFQHHLKAISLFSQAITTELDKLIENLDILLRWFTLRFYDRNTTVHIKLLEFLSDLLKKLSSQNYRLSEYEMAAFLPHLIIKIGESKENIRKGVVEILKLVLLMYPASKMFNYIMEGIKSKNSRQRQECLDFLAFLIDNHGIGVCQPTPPKALKEIAANISDRDKDVRSSALNAIVAAYNKSGEIIFKQVGKLNEKDRSMLEERVKRCGNFQESVPSEGLPPNKSASGAQKIVATTSQKTGNAATSPVRQQEKKAAVVRREDGAEMEELLKAHGIFPVPKSSFTEAELAEACRPYSFPPDFQVLWDKHRVEFMSPQIDDLILKISNMSFEESIPALKMINKNLTEESEADLFVGKCGKLLESYTIQLRMILEWYLPLFSKGEGIGSLISISKAEFSSLCKLVFIGLYEISNSKALLREVTADQFFGVLRMIFQLLNHPDFTILPSHEHMTKSINVIMYHFIINADTTSLHCAMIKTLQDSLELEMRKYIELCCRCIWKIVHNERNLLEDNLEEARRSLRLGELLFAMNELWTVFPPRHPIYKKFDDLPVRTINSTLLKFCDIIGPSFIDDTKYIPNPRSSGIVKIIMKKLGVRSLPTIQAHPNRKENVDDIFTESLEGKLAEIFKKISNREQTKIGLQELHTFQNENPTYDVEGKINGQKTDLYRDYIRRGLSQLRQGTFGKPVAAPKELDMKAEFSFINRVRQEAGLPLADYSKYLNSKSEETVTNGNANSISEASPVIPPVGHGSASPTVQELRRILDRIKNE